MPRFKRQAPMRTWTYSCVHSLLTRRSVIELFPVSVSASCPSAHAHSPLGVSFSWPETHTAAAVPAHRDGDSVVGIHPPALPSSIDIQERNRRLRKERMWVARSRLLSLLSLLPVLVSMLLCPMMAAGGQHTTPHLARFRSSSNVSHKPSLFVFEFSPVGTQQQPLMSLCRWSQKAEREEINNRSV